jgi:hypothetical protein
MDSKFATDFLTAQSSFRLGIASVMNIGGSFFLYNYSGTPAEADARALRSDWRSVGHDMVHALKQHDPRQTELPLGV